MKDALNLNIGGIKCDNPNCDFIDKNVKLEDYEKWLNKPCPKCGCNLLTEKDYKSVKRLLKFTKTINKIFGKVSDETKETSIKLDMNGTGNIKVKNINFEGDDNE